MAVLTLKKSDSSNSHLFPISWKSFRQLLWDLHILQMAIFSMAILNNFELMIWLPKASVLIVKLFLLNPRSKTFCRVRSCSLSAFKMGQFSFIFSNDLFSLSGVELGPGLMLSSLGLPWLSSSLVISCLLMQTNVFTSCLISWHHKINFINELSNEM